VTVPDPRSGGPDEKTVVVPTGQAQPPPYGRPYPPTAQYPPVHAQGHYEQPTTNLAYNPYGHQFPAVDQYPDGYPAPQPARRPLGVFVAFLLHLVSALPFLAGSAFALVSGASLQSMIPAEQLAEFETVTGVDVGSLFALLYGVIVFVGVVALLFVIFSILAVARRNWARILVAVMTFPFVALAAVGALGALGVAGTDAANDPLALGAALAIVAGPGTLALIGTILLFTPRANRFFSRR
jgi:hypothetical protein